MTMKTEKVKMSVPKTGSMNKRARRAEKMAVSEKMTNGFMLTLTYGLGAILLLEVARRQYAAWNFDFASKYSIVLGVIFALMTVGAVIWGIAKSAIFKKAMGYAAFFVVSSLVSFFVSYDMRLPASRALLGIKTEGWGVWNFLANLDIARDIKYIEYGVVVYIAVAFVVYAIRLARVEKKK